MTTATTHQSIQIIQAALETLFRARGHGDADGMILPTEVLQVDDAVHVRLTDHGQVKNPHTWVVVHHRAGDRWVGWIADDDDLELQAAWRW